MKNIDICVEARPLPLRIFGGILDTARTLRERDLRIIFLWYLSLW